jgi:hypothetical protein
MMDVDDAQPIPCSMLKVVVFVVVFALVRYIFSFYIHWYVWSMVNTLIHQSLSVGQKNHWTDGRRGFFLMESLFIIHRHTLLIPSVSDGPGRVENGILQFLSSSMARYMYFL